ncbi:MAG: alpha/beta hydrolase [Patescibacteria group bacterium]|nr:alpha/beta hydrolase [Patescibacteria group bacterium]
MGSEAQPQIIGTIVLIHGMWCTPWVWDNFMFSLTLAGYKPLALELKFHSNGPGNSRHLLGTTGLEGYKEDIVRQLGQIPGPVHLIGHSMGGLLAAKAASQGPKEIRNRVKTLVLITPAAPYGINGLTGTVMKSFLGPLVRGWPFWKNPIKPTFQEAQYAMLHLLPEEEQKRIYQDLVWESGRAAFQCGFWPLDKTRAARVDEIHCPVLVLAGSQDRITPAPVVKKIAQKLGAEYKEFSGHAHWLLAEPGWEEILEFIIGWIQKKSS